MRFSKLIAMIAIAGLAIQAKADTTGIAGEVKAETAQTQQQKTQAAPVAQPGQGVVILNSNSSTTSSTSSNANTNKPTQQAEQQPVTVVEAAPVVESKASDIRKERQQAEVQTEETIDEKLEESRLKDEKARAERLFGNRLDAQPAVQPVAVAAPAVTNVTEQKPVQPEVNIDKIEIVQPKADKDKKSDDDLAASSKMPLPAPKQEQKVYIGATLGGMEYQASNVKTNYAMGLSIGTILPSNWAVEANFMYSNHYVDNIWEFPIFHELDQYNIGVAAKYYLFNSRIKPYVGAEATYIYRKYYDRLPFFNMNSTISQEETSAVNGGVLAGVDFAISDSFLIGGGVEYSRNLFDKSDINFAAYGLPTGQKLLEEIDFYTLNVTAKMMF